MNPAVKFLGWAALTYYWLDANWRFLTAIVQAIQEHNDEIRQRDEEDEEDEN